MTPAEIIARAFSNAPFPSSRSLTSARRTIEALRAAGYDILGPGEYHARTKEAAAKVAEAAGDTWSGGRDSHQCVQEAAVDDKCVEIAIAIRALADGGRSE